MPDSALIAAVDLGSNSFRLQVARIVDGGLLPVDTLKETVRFGAGLDARGHLTPAAQAEALAALARFGERLRGLDPSQVRAVATNTFRVAKNAAEFVPQAEAALGFAIDVIGGSEEARLIYLGAAHSLPATREKRLVVDIGGGSTELIVGRQFKPLLTESTLMGCVSWSMRFFPDGVIDAARLEQAELAARTVLQPLVPEVAAAGWQSAIGTSGTARSLSDILELNDLSPSGITADGLAQLRELLLRAGHVDAVALDGLRPDRRPVLAGGFAIMAAAFDAFDIERMTITYGALRDGVMYDLVGRQSLADVRDTTVAAFVRRHQADIAQSNRVAALAGALFEQLPQARSDITRGVKDAAQLHEIGRSISHASFHKHSAYIVRHADMPGFSRREQARLAALVLAQQGKLAKLDAEGLSAIEWSAVLALRLAVLFCRNRRDTPLPPLRLSADGDVHTLALPAAWLQAHPLTRYALEEEARAWQKSGRTLTVNPD